MDGAKDGILCQINSLREQFGPPAIFKYFAKRRPIFRQSSHILLNERLSELHLDYLRLFLTTLNPAQNRQNRLASLQ